MMDISETTAPRSDQQNYDDYANGITRTVTITEVRRGSDEQPVEIHLAEFPDRPFKPSKSMRRVLVAAWGPEAAAYVGRRMELYGDPTVKFGGSTVGGIRIAKLSHIEKRMTLGLTVTRGKRAPYVVEPLLDAPAPDPQAARIAALRKEWNAADPDRRKVIEARVAELTEQPPAEPIPPVIDDPASEPVPPISAKQVTALQILAQAKGFRDRDARLAWAAQVIQYDLESFSELNATEAAMVREALNELPDVPK